MRALVLKLLDDREVHELEFTHCATRKLREQLRQEFLVGKQRGRPRSLDRNGF